MFVLGFLFLIVVVVLVDQLADLSSIGGAVFDNTSATSALRDLVKYVGNEVVLTIVVVDGRVGDNSHLFRFIGLIS